MISTSLKTISMENGSNIIITVVIEMKIILEWSKVLGKIHKLYVIE